MDLSRLVGTLQAIQYAPGDKIIGENDLTQHIILIEKGRAAIASSKVQGKLTRNEIDKTMGILRPREGKRRSVEFMNATELKKYLENSNDIQPEEADGGKGEKEKLKADVVCEVYDGCMLGIPSLRGKANLPDGWKWIKNGKQEGAESPFTMIAATHMNCLVFTVEVFENLFGPAEKVIKSQANAAKKGGAAAEEKSTTVKEIIFDSTKFKMKYVLGSGSFGVVTLAEYRADKSQPPTNYALKSLSKLMRCFRIIIM
jgi:hypothetical protein